MAALAKLRIGLHHDAPVVLGEGDDRQAGFLHEAQRETRSSLAQPRGQSHPIDGLAGLRKAVGLVWPEARVQRCAVHKLRNLERKAPKHALAEIRADFHRIVYAESAASARAAHAAFARKWAPRCPGVVRSLQEGGEEVLTFFEFPKAQWKTLRTTNVIERLHEEFRRRVKTQGSLPTEDAALVLLFGLIVSGQIRLRRLDGWRQIPTVQRERRQPAA